MISSSQLGVKSTLIKTKLQLFILVGVFKRIYTGIGKQYHNLPNKYPVDLWLCEPDGWFITVWSWIAWFLFFNRLFLHTFQRQMKKNNLSLFTCKLHCEAEVSYRLIASRAFTADLLTWFVKFAKYMVRCMPQQSENKTRKVKFCIQCPKWHSGTKNTLVWGYRDKNVPISLRWSTYT